LVEKFLDYLINLNNILGVWGILALSFLIIVLILGLANKLTNGNLVTIFTTFITTLFSGKKIDTNSTNENNEKGE